MSEDGKLDIPDQLRLRFASPEWALFFEVANGLGIDQRRYADAVAMSLFPSRGLDIHGLEVKRSRGDWLRELKDPKKADVIASYCDFWWLVTSDEKVADKNELPRAWGLLVSNGKELRQVKRAERMKAKPIDRPFLGAVLRRADQWLTSELKSDARVVAAKEEGRKVGLEERNWQLRDDSSELEKLKNAVKEFEDASGVHISTYNAGQIGEAVKAFMYSMKHDVTEELDLVAAWADGMAKKLRERSELMKKSRQPAPADPAPAASAGGLA